MGYNLNNRKCEPCIESNCIECTVSSICTNCDGGYALVSDGCEACIDNNCEVCSTPSVCT